MPKNLYSKSDKKAEMSNVGKKAEFSRILSPISPRLSKKVLEKLKFFQKKGKKPVKISNTKNRQLYVQVSFSNIKKILKIKEIHKTINEPRCYDSEPLELG